MAVVALVDHQAGTDRFLQSTLDAVAVDVEDLEAVSGHHAPVAVFEIGDGIGEGRQRDGVGAQIHLAVAVADRERRAVARADQQIVIVLEQDGEREGTMQTRRSPGGRLPSAPDHGAGRWATRWATTSVSVWVANSKPSASSSVAQFAEILDDAVMDDGDVVGEMRMRVGLVGHAMRRPAGVADADTAFERRRFQPGFEIDQLALGAAAVEMAVFDRGDAGRIIAAIFEPLQRVDDQGRDGLLADDADNSAHSANSDRCCLLLFDSDRIFVAAVIRPSARPTNPA